MTKEQIDQEIANEAIAFNNKIYDGMPLPDDIIIKFRRGIMAFGTDRPELIKQLVSKKIEELTWVDAGTLINYVKKIPYEKIFDSIEEALDYNIHLTEIVKSYNEVCNKVDGDLESKRQLKYKLAGVNGKAVPFSAR